MSETIFKRVEFDLKGLISEISLGTIGLPDIQRPFVWKNVKVRDLFDSMYRGYPVGYLLFWETNAEVFQAANPRTIGADNKQVYPKLMVVDGQQRLTSLYSVVKGVQIVRDNYESERIRIAFNPLEETFEVTSAAIERDKVYIPDISVVWSNTGIFSLARGYLEGLESVRDVSDSDRRRVEISIERLKGIESFPLTALQLDSSTSEADVSEVFVRINSQGKNLNQADFILTLMSVFWDQGRTELENFCRQSIRPSRSGASPFNYFIDPAPDQLLRVSVGLAFKRARLQHVYSILRGKNLETGQFSKQHRNDQFDALRKAQNKTLDLQHWHDFMKCIRKAGFRSKRMVRSQTNLLFSYILYLIGRTEYHVPEFSLRRVIAQWFFMSAATRRYTASPESAMESDLAMLRGVQTSEEFVSRIQRVCGITLTDDFWKVTLPNELANSSTISPSLIIYEAAQILLDAPVLFSTSKIGDLLDPAIQAKRAAVERHHLFPKGHLSSLNIEGTRETNQVANLAYMEWPDNVRISDQSPAEYFPELLKQMGNAASVAFRCHALPKDWEQMDYHQFLQARRELMARVIERGYQRLIADSVIIGAHGGLNQLILTGESDSVEFKSTLRVNLHTGRRDGRMENAVLKTLAGFLNTDGGTLVIGVSDDGSPVGISADQFASEDQMNLHLVNLVGNRLGSSFMTMVHTQFADYRDNRVLRIRCERSSSPVYVRNNDREQFFIRTGPATAELTGGEMVEYVARRFD